jgi:hypothetical protein
MTGSCARTNQLRGDGGTEDDDDDERDLLESSRHGCPWNWWRGGHRRDHTCPCKEMQSAKFRKSGR